MKNLVIVLLLSLLSACVTENINTVLSTHELHEIRLRKLNDFCAKINEEVIALKLIINSDWGKSDYITNLEPTTAGYRINFAKGGSVNIYNGLKGNAGNKGENGENGTNGKDGEDGIDGMNGLNAPIIGAEKYSDNLYYWTITTNGITTWLLGEEGEKLRVTGAKGENGEEGTPGKPGANGVLPQLSVDAEGYWIINGVRLLYKGLPVTATGPQGPQGDPGKDQVETGPSGDLIIKEVIPQTDSVVFILTTNNSRFSVPRQQRAEIRINSSTKGAFYFGQTLPIDFTCTGVTQVTAVVPAGWKAITDFTTRKVIVSAPAEDDLYGDREGELTLITSNPTGYSITANLKITAVQAYKVTGWNFKDSRVYNVLNPQGAKIAEVCTEYIPGYSEKQQAIVVYPYDIQTKSYGKGFVVNGGGYVYHDGNQYSGAGQEGNNYPTVYVTHQGISVQQPKEYIATRLEADQLSDFEGNTYPITKIGKQYWTTRNWNSTHYIDGSPIPFENDFSQWSIRGEAGEALYGYPNNDPALRNTYGLLYNMPAIKTGKLFPEGWVIPSSDIISGDNDCQDLLDYLGENDNLKLRSTLWGNDTENGDWIPSGNNRGNNLSGFNSSPTGYLIGSKYDHFGEFGVYWTSSFRWNTDHHITNSYNVMNLRNYMSIVAMNGLHLIGEWGAFIRLIRKD